MCIIINLAKGVTIPFPALQNGVWNNPHGYGLVVMKGNSKMEVIRELPEGGTTPEEVRDLLDKYIDFPRFLHLRWKTEGEISLENTQPFEVYNDGKTQVLFMHNGTLYDFKPQQTDKRSDSRIFAEDFLKPLLVMTKGDYNTDLSRRIITKFWGMNGASKGLILSNKAIPMYINYSDWKDIKLKNDDGTEVEFKASNDTYFETLTRGYEFDRREAERKAKQPVLPFVGGSSQWPLVKLKDIDLAPNLFKDIRDIFADIDLYSDEGTASLGNLTSAEILTMNEKDPEIIMALFVHVTGMYSDLYVEHLEVTDKHEKATKLIAAMKQAQQSKVG